MRYRVSRCATSFDSPSRTRSTWIGIRRPADGWRGTAGCEAESGAPGSCSRSTGVDGSQTSSANSSRPACRGSVRILLDGAMRLWQGSLKSQPPPTTTHSRVCTSSCLRDFQIAPASFLRSRRSKCNLSSLVRPHRRSRPARPDGLLRRGASCKPESDSDRRQQGADSDHRERQARLTRSRSSVGFNGSAGELPALAPAGVPGDCLADGLEDEVARGDDFGVGVCATGVADGRADGVAAGGGGGGAEPGFTASPLICFNTLLPATLPGHEPSESYV